MDDTVGWLLDVPGRLKKREALMIHLVQNEVAGPKLVLLFQSWQQDCHQAMCSARPARLTLRGRPRDLEFDDDDSKLLYNESLRLCGLDPALAAKSNGPVTLSKVHGEKAREEERVKKQRGKEKAGENDDMEEDREEKGQTRTSEKSLCELLAEMEEAQRWKREEEDRKTREAIQQIMEEERQEAERRRIQRERDDEAQAKEIARLLLQEELERARQERLQQDAATQKMIKDMLRREEEEEKRRRMEEEATSALVAKELQAKEEELKQVECGICMDDFDPMDKFIMGSCGHYYCRNCAFEYFQTNLNEFPIKCPSCKEPVSDEALEIILPSELFSKYDKFRFERALQNDKDFNRCLTPDCENGVIIPRDAGLPYQAWQWKCEVCNKKYCLKCNDDSHDSTCEAYRQWKKENGMADDKFQELIDSGVLKLCPHCNTRTQKTEGCNFMTCNLCRRHWCWQCGLTHAACPGGHNSHK